MQLIFSDRSNLAIAGLFAGARPPDVRAGARPVDCAPHRASTNPAEVRAYKACSGVAGQPRPVAGSVYPPRGWTLLAATVVTGRQRGSVPQAAALFESRDAVRLIAGVTETSGSTRRSSTEHFPTEGVLCRFLRYETIALKALGSHCHARRLRRFENRK